MEITLKQPSFFSLPPEPEKPNPEQMEIEIE